MPALAGTKRRCVHTALRLDVRWSGDRENYGMALGMEDRWGLHLRWGARDPKTDTCMLVT